MEDYTRKFNAAKEKDEEIHHILTSVYTALEEKGYNPINQLVGYILSEDPPTHQPPAGTHTDPQAGSRRAATGSPAQLPEPVKNFRCFEIPRGSKKGSRGILYGLVDKRRGRW